MTEQALLAAWKATGSDLQTPDSQPSESILLWQNLSCTVYVEDKWGPHVPYPSVDHGDGEKNHGYRRLKGDVEAVNAIPEAQGWPALQRFLVQVNGNGSPVETVGCEKGFFPVTEHESITVTLGSYFDIVFSEPAKNERPEAFISLAARLLDAVDGCERWWGSVEIGFQRMRRLPGCELPWGMLLRVSGAGRTEAEARRTWEETISRLGAAIESLPVNFPA